MKIDFPTGGLYEGGPNSEQPPGTSDNILNVSAINPPNGRLTGAQRAGLSKFCPAVLPGGGKVSEINSVTIDNTKLLFSSLGDNVTQEWSATQPTPSDCKAFVLDVQSNVYAISFPATIVKYNSEGTVLWTLSLPTGDPANEVRAVCVDDAGNVYAAVSNGGAQSKAKMWGYAQQSDNGTLLIWELKLGVFVEEMGFRDNLLWTAQNDTDRNLAYVITYTNIDIPNPTETQRWSIPAPVNGLALSPKDKSVFTSHQPSTTRGLDLSSSQTTWISEDWTIKDLANWKKRLWSWHDAKVRSSLGLISNASGQDDGTICAIWEDISGNGRHWYGGNNVAGHTSDTGPTYQVSGIGGNPSLRFNGSNQSMISAGSAGVDPTFRDQYPTPIPCYSGAQFVWCAVMRVPIEQAIRWGIVLPNGATVADRGVFINCQRISSAGNETSSGGSILVHEQNAAASDAGASATAAFAPTGQDGDVLPGAFGPYGLVLVTWVCDGGDHDVFGTATRSQLRINGQPADRWQSAKFATNQPTRFGVSDWPVANVSPFTGEVVEMICLSDWYDNTGAKQRLITQDNYPDAAWNTIGAGGSDTELERLEGWLAHRNGIAHLLPSGTMSYLKQVGIAAAGNAVTIGGVVYTFVAALTPAANEVLVGVDGTDSFRNLRDAINRTGAPGVKYGAATVQNPLYVAVGPIARNNTPQYMLGIRSRDPQQAVVALAAPAFGTWTGANTQTNINPPGGGATSNEAHFPHPFAYARSPTTYGGPPRTAGATTISNYWRMLSQSGMLVKWDGANGKAKWVATSNYDGWPIGIGSGTGLGGVGYGCRISSVGDVYTVGPRQALSTNPNVNADAFDARKITDNGDTFNIGGATDPWAAAAAAWTGVNPRPAVDKFGNVFIPWHNSPNTITFAGAAWTEATKKITLTNAFLNYTFRAGDTLQITAGGGGAVLGLYTIASKIDDSNITLTTSPGAGSTGLGGFTITTFINSLIAYQKASNGAGVGVPICTVTNITNDPQAFCVGVDANYPSGTATTRPEFVYLATRQEAGGTIVIYKLRLVTSAPQSGSPRSEIYVGVNGGTITQFSSAGTTAITGGVGALASTADYVSSVAAFKRIFFVDGTNEMVYDPALGTVVPWKSKTSGLIKKRAKLVDLWRGRMWLARFDDDPTEWMMLRQGDPFDADVYPAVPDDTQAVTGTAARAGRSPDLINCIFSYLDDFCIFGCQGSIWRLTGDPMENGKMHPVTEVIGMSFGKPFDRDPLGNIYFHSTDGQIYRMDFLAQQVVPMTSTRIPRRLRDLDLSQFYVRLLWDTRRMGLHVYVLPFGAGGTATTHYFWEQRSDAWMPEQFGIAGSGVQPTAVAIIDGDTTANRVLLQGSADGYVRFADEAAVSDDGTQIDSHVDIGFGIGDGDLEAKVTGLLVQLARDQDEARFEVFVSDTAEVPGVSVAHGMLSPGLSPHIRFRARGGYVTLRISNANPSSRWGWQAGEITVVPAGRRRVRT